VYFQGVIPLAIHVDSADVMATLLELKAEVESLGGGEPRINIVFIGAAEAHLLAEELAAANVGVILSPPRGYPFAWETRRMYVVPSFLPD
jgi:hypothetical protein